MGDVTKPAPAADKSESKTAPDADKAETTQENNSDMKAMREQISALEKRAKDAEKKAAAFERKGKTAEELEAALAKREEEFKASDETLRADLEKHSKLLKQTLKPRLEALPENTRKLVERAGKDGPDALLEALELAEKGNTAEKPQPQGERLPSLKPGGSLVNADGEFDVWAGFGEIAKRK